MGVSSFQTMFIGFIGRIPFKKNLYKHNKKSMINGCIIISNYVYWHD